MAFIFMADIKESSKHFPPSLLQNFTEMVNHFNEQYSSELVSPLTITLGDEFQGIVKDMHTGLDIMVTMEEYMLSAGFKFKLRYVLNEGEIETPINTEIAHGMIGSGLTKTRQILNDLKASKVRFEIRLKEAKMGIALSGLFHLYQHFMDSWHAKDLLIASLFIKGMGYKEVANHLQKDESSVWRKRRSLAIEEYFVCKTLILNLA